MKGNTFFHRKSLRFFTFILWKTIGTTSKTINAFFVVTVMTVHVMTVHLPVYCDSTQFSLTVVTVHTDCYDRYKIFPDCYESTYSLLIISDCNYSTQFFLTVMIVFSIP